MAKVKGRIEREDLVLLIEKGLGTRAIGKVLDRGQASVRYWLRIHGLRTVYPKAGSTRCGVCGETDPDKFYGNKKRVCGKCHNQYTKKVGREKKQKAREYLGNECYQCGFKKYKTALAIHHTDPSAKDPCFGSMRNWSWEKIERELRSCVLLCCNCHTAHHAGELKVNFTGS